MYKSLLEKQKNTYKNNETTHEIKYLNKIKEEGIYTFGGKLGNNKIRSKLLIMKCGN